MEFKSVAIRQRGIRSAKDGEEKVPVYTIEVTKMDGTKVSKEFTREEIAALVLGG